MAQEMPSRQMMPAAAAPLLLAGSSSARAARPRPARTPPGRPANGGARARRCVPPTEGSGALRARRRLLLTRPRRWGFSTPAAGGSRTCPGRCALARGAGRGCGDLRAGAGTLVLPKLKFLCAYARALRRAERAAVARGGSPPLIEGSLRSVASHGASSCPAPTSSAVTFSTCSPRNNAQAPSLMLASHFQPTQAFFPTGSALTPSAPIFAAPLFTRHPRRDSAAATKAGSCTRKVGTGGGQAGGKRLPRSVTVRATQENNATAALKASRQTGSRSSAHAPPASSLPLFFLPGGSGALCGWRSGAIARRRGRRWRCGAASIALPAGSWPCAAPACSSARSAPSPPPSGWGPTGSSCSARYPRPAPLGSSWGPRRRRAAGASRWALRVAALGSRRAPAGPCRGDRVARGPCRANPGLPADPSEPRRALPCWCGAGAAAALRLLRFRFGLSGLFRGTKAGRIAGVNWQWFAMR